MNEASDKRNSSPYCSIISCSGVKHFGHIHSYTFLTNTFNTTLVSVFHHNVLVIVFVSHCLRCMTHCVVCLRCQSFLFLIQSITTTKELVGSHYIKHATRMQYMAGFAIITICLHGGYLLHKNPFLSGGSVSCSSTH